MFRGKTIENLNYDLDLIRIQKRALYNLRLKGHISQEVFQFLGSKLSRQESIILELKENLETEEKYWKASLSEERRILELKIVELEHERLMGNISDQEWQRKNTIITLGLGTLEKDNLLNMNKSKIVQTTKRNPEHDPFLKSSLNERKQDRKPSGAPKAKRQSDEGHSQKELENKRNLVNQQERKKVKIESSDIENSPVSALRCMNPWKESCKNTNIELSIFYKGQMIPVCQKCWEEISNMDTEWSNF